MWIAKVMSITTDQEGNEQLYVTKYCGSENLKDVYEEAMKACKKKRTGLTAFYKGMTAEKIFNDDATKEETAAEYLILKGELGGIILYGKKHKRRLCTIRENKEEKA